MCVFFFLSFSIHGSILTSLLHDTKNKITQFYDRTFMLDTPERTDIVEDIQRDDREQESFSSCHIEDFLVACGIILELKSRSQRPYNVATNTPCPPLILPSCSCKYIFRAVHQS
jgi:hypothetical protein